MIFNLDHDAVMVHFAVDTLAAKLKGDARYFDRLKAAIDAGDEIGPDESVARMMEADVRTLVALAASVEGIRLALIANAMPRLRFLGALHA